MSIETNGGILSTNLKGYLKNYSEVWYHPYALTNILSLFNVKNKYRVTFDSGKDNKFIVHKPEEKLAFTQSSNGLYSHDTNKREIVLLDTVDEKRRNTVRDSIREQSRQGGYIPKLLVHLFMITRSL